MQSHGFDIADIGVQQRWNRSSHNWTRSCSERRCA
jgi:hypothetical protein